jgi:hypothetical protein
MKFILVLIAIQFLTTNQSCNKDSIPGCIEKMTQGDPSATPLRIDEYEYQGKRVFYVTEDCCDKFNTVYDESCNPLCAPSGGLTGMGDGKCPDFDSKAKLIKKIWEKKQ